MKLSCTNIKKSLIFSQKKAFLIFQETELFIFQWIETPEEFIIYSRKKAFYILENKTPKKILYISGGITSKASKTKISYISPKQLMKNFF